jgi:hypothetical protein
MQHGTSVYTISSEGLAPASHSGIQTHDVRFIRSLHCRSNHCVTWATSMAEYYVKRDHNPKNVYKVECRATQTPDKNEGMTRCHGGVYILC